MMPIMKVMIHFQVMIHLIHFKLKNLENKYWNNDMNTPNQKIRKSNPPKIIRYRFRRSCCHLCGSIGDSVIKVTKPRYRTCKSCNDNIVKLVKKREIWIQRKNQKVIMSLIVRECLHYDHLCGIVHYMSTFL